MPASIPKRSAAMLALLRSDFTTQWRNRRSLLLILLVPVIILMAWKPMVVKLGAAFVLSSCITIGLTAIGLMGYSNSIARDRDKGIFQRLRVAPIPNSCIMISRLLVQMTMIILLTTIVFIVGHEQLHIILMPAAYVMGMIAAVIGGAVYLGLGQMIAGLQKNAETVNATTRLVYFLFIMVGMFGELGVLGAALKNIVRWSPYGTVKTIISAALQPVEWNNQLTLALLVTIAYGIIFSVLGIRWFKWNTR